MWRLLRLIRQEGNKKWAQAMAERGLKAPEGFEVIDPTTLKPDNYKELYLQDLKEVALEKKLLQMKYNAVHKGKRNDCLTLELGRAIISSKDTIASRAFTKYFPAVKQRQEFVLNFVSNPGFPELQEEVVFTMSKYCEATFKNKRSYGKKLWIVIRQIMERIPHFNAYQVVFKGRGGIKILKRNCCRRIVPKFLPIG